MSIKRNSGEKDIKILKERIRQLEKELNEKKGGDTGNPHAIYNTVLELFSSAYFIYNIKSEAFQSNASFNALMREFCDSDQVSGDMFLKGIHPDDKAAFYEIFAEPKSIKRRINFTFRFIPISKEAREIQYFMLKGFYSSLPDNSLILLCGIRNVSRETKALRELQRNFEKADSSDKIKTHFLLNISHHIRTPMNSILGFAELLSMTDPPAERRREFIQVIKKQSKSLLQLIDDIAEIAKYETGQMTVAKAPVNLNLLLGEIISEVESIRSPEGKEAVKMVFHSPTAQGLEMYTDAGRIHQVFSSIISHSLKYTIEGYIEIGYRLPDEGKISFFIKDTSKGVNKESIRQLFEKMILPANTEESRYNEETTLNLSIARSIVKLLGGRLNVEEMEEGGIKFSWALPFETPPSGNNETAIDDLSLNLNYKWNDKLILIVEDEEVNGVFLEAVLQETGARTLYARNGIQAIELIKSMPEKIDLVLMDIKMPVMNGLKATQEIRKFNIKLPIVAQTALAMEEDKQQCLLAGCNDSITKPIDVEELLRIINKYFT